MSELPMVLPYETVAKVQFAPQAEPEVNLGGTPEINFRAFCQAFMEAMSARVPDGQDLVVKKEQQLESPVKSAWEIQFHANGEVTAKKSDVPEFVRMSFAIGWIANYERKHASRIKS